MHKIVSNSGSCRGDYQVNKDEHIQHKEKIEEKELWEEEENSRATEG